MTIEELNDILAIDESYRIERAVSTGNMDKFQEAICAFANDLANKCPTFAGIILFGHNPRRFMPGAMKSLGYVNRYNRGIGQVQKELSENGNPKAEFDVNLLTAFAVEVKKSSGHNKKGHKSGTSQPQV